MARSADLETIAVEKIVCYSYQKEGAGHAGKHQGQSGGRRIKEKTWARVLLWFPWERTGEIG